MSNSESTSALVSNVVNNTNDSSHGSKSTNVSKPRISSNFFRRVPPFSSQRLSNQKNSVDIKNIKQDNSINLNKLSLFELNELLRKQNKLIQNKTLLSKLNDNGEKIIAFREKIIEAIQIKDDIEKTEEIFSKLSLCSINEDGQAKAKQRMQMLQKHETDIAQPRLNLPKKIELLTKVENSQQNSQEAKTHKEIKTLGLQDSLKTLELTTLKNKSSMAEQVLRLYKTESDESDYEGEIQSEEEFYDDDTDLTVNVHSAEL